MNTYNIHINLPPEAVSLATAPVAVNAPDLELAAELGAARKTIEAIARAMQVEDTASPAELVDRARGLIALDVTLNEVALAVGYHGNDNAPIPGLVIDRITEARHLEEQVAQLTGDLKEAEGTIAELRSIRAQLTGELAQAEKRAASAGATTTHTYKVGDLVTVTWPDGTTTAPGIVRGDDPDSGRYKVDYFDLPPSGGSGETWAEPSRLTPRSGEEPGDPPAEEPKKAKRTRAKKADAPAPSDTITWPEGVTREEYAAWKNEQHAVGITEGVNPMEFKRLRDAGLIIAKPPAEEAKPPAPDAPTAELLHPGTRVTYEANPGAGIYQGGTGSIVSPSKVHGGPGYVVERDQGGRCVMTAASVKEVVAEEVLEEEPAQQDQAPTERTSQLAKAFDQLPKASLTVGAKVLALLTRGDVVFAAVETVWDNGLRVQLKTAEGREFVEGERIRARRVVYLTPGGERLAATIIGFEHLETGRVDLVFEESGKDAMGVPVMDLWPAPDAPVEPDSQFTDDPAEVNPFAGSDF